MTQAADLLQLLRAGPMTLGEILRADGMRYASEYRRIFTNLRAEGLDIRYHHVQKDGRCKGCAVLLLASLDCPARQRGPCYQLHQVAVC